MFAEDLDIYFDEDGFAETITVGGSAWTCIFDNDFLVTGEIEGTAPAAYGATVDLPAVAHGTAVTRDGTGQAYTVVGIEPDATGRITILVLEEVD